MQYKRSRRSGFTLVEMLVVIIIIGILASLLIVTIQAAIYRSRVSQIVFEIAEIERAVEDFKNKYSVYPADNTNPQVTARTIRRMFPRIDLRNELPATMQALQTMDAAESLPFWLGGFSSDAKRPFSGPGGPFYTPQNANDTKTRNAGIYEFTPERLTQDFDTNRNRQWSTDEVLLHGQAVQDNDIFPVYLIPRLNNPYVYFDSRTYIHRPENNPAPQPPLPQWPPAAYIGTTGIQGVARPYRNGLLRENIPDPTAPTQFDYQFFSPKKFQIICAGLEEDYGFDGPDKRFSGPDPTALFFNINDMDEQVITNFSGGLIRDMQQWGTKP